MTGVRGFAAGALATLLLACQSTPTTRVYRAEPANTGTEHYSAWFGDTDGDVLYFGLSPFWELWWETGADALADLEEVGDHLIGRFDLRGEYFLPPLRVRAAEDGARSSVWDVLAHSNGRIYYTTYFEGIGSVRSDGSDARGLEPMTVGLDADAEAEFEADIRIFEEMFSAKARFFDQMVENRSPDAIVEIRELRQENIYEIAEFYYLLRIFKINTPAKLKKFGKSHNANSCFCQPSLVNF